MTPQEIAKLTDFQRWALVYAANYGFTVTTRGTGVSVAKDGVTYISQGDYKMIIRLCDQEGEEQ